MPLVAEDSAESKLSGVRSENPAESAGGQDGRKMRLERGGRHDGRPRRRSTRERASKASGGRRMIMNVYDFGIAKSVLSVIHLKGTNETLPDSNQNP